MANRIENVETVRELYGASNRMVNTSGHIMRGLVGDFRHTECGIVIGLVAEAERHFILARSKLMKAADLRDDPERVWKQ